MKKYKGGFKPAFKRKMDKLLIQKGYSFRGNSPETLKLNMEIQKNKTLIIL